MAITSREGEIIDAYAIIREQVIDQLEERRIPLGGELEPVRTVVQEVVNLPSPRPLGRWSRSGRPCQHGSSGACLGHRLRSAGRAVRPSRHRRDLHRGRRSGLHRWPGSPAGHDHAHHRRRKLQTVERLLATGERHLDAKSPIVQARILGGQARLTACIPPVADVL